MRSSGISALQGKGLNQGHKACSRSAGANCHSSQRGLLKHSRMSVSLVGDSVFGDDCVVMAHHDHGARSCDALLPLLCRGPCPDSVTLRPVPSR
jgi:hypothetical protein